MFDQAKMKMLSQLIESFVPEFEIKIVENAIVNKEKWMLLIMVREKEKK